jgi:tetratricopeptide (TPR) repeat protein
MIKVRNIYIFIVILFFLITYSFADITDAREIYKNGESSESLILYKKWLSNNQKTEDFISVLFEISELNGDILLISEILDDNIKYVSDREQKKLLYERLAQIYELSSNLHDAQINYQNSALCMLDKIDYKMLLKSAEILILKGDVIHAESQLNEIILNSRDSSIISYAEIIYTIVQLLQSSKQPDISDHTFNTPKTLYLVYLIAMANSIPLEIESKKQEVLEEYESSPEAALLRNKIKELPDIISSLGLLNSSDKVTLIKEIFNPSTAQNFMIQTGSFTDPENAYYLMIDLKEAGFSPVVEVQKINNTEYNKVILYFSSEENLRETLIQLKEKGFEGFPIY